MSFVSKPSAAGFKTVTACRRLAVMSLDCILNQRLEVVEKYMERGVSGGALQARRCFTRRMIAATGQHKWCPLRTCPIFSFLTPFFCVEKVREQKSAVSSLTKAQFIISIYVLPRRRHRSINRKGAESFFDAKMVYSTGQSKKKKASMIMSAIALVPSAAAATANAVVARYKITWKGIGLTRSGGGSSRW